MKKQGSKEDCQGCGYWYPFPARSRDSIRMGKCLRPITYYNSGKSYANGIFPKTSADMHCGDWKPKDIREP